MIINAKNVFLYKCPECDEFVQTSVSLFDIPKNNKIEIMCKCKKSSAEIKNTSSYYQIRLTCFLCGEDHTYSISSYDFWNSPFYALTCPNNAYDIAAIGDYEQTEIWKKQYDEMLDSICIKSGSGYFENDDVMFAIMEVMKKLGDEDKIYCECGNHEIDFALYPDKIQFSCLSCNAMLDIYCRNNEDYEKVAKLGEFVLRKLKSKSSNLHLVKK